MTRAMAQEMKDALPEAMAEAETPPITEPVRLKSGQFRDQDRFHKGSSTSTIYRLPDGSQLSKSGRPPSDQRSGLVGHPHAESKPGRSWGGNWSGPLELAKLKGNTGNQNYPIPDDAYI